MIIYSSDIVYIHVLTVLHILGLTPRSRRNLATFTSPTLQASINGVKSPSEIMIEKSFNVHSEKNGQRSYQIVGVSLLHL